MVELTTGTLVLYYNKKKSKYRQNEKYNVYGVNEVNRGRMWRNTEIMQ